MNSESQGQATLQDHLNLVLASMQAAMHSINVASAKAYEHTSTHDQYYACNRAWRELDRAIQALLRKGSGR